MWVAFIIAIFGISSFSVSALTIEFEKTKIFSREPLNQLNALVTNDKNNTVAVHVYMDQTAENNVLISQHQFILGSFESTQINIKWVNSKKLNQSIKTTLFFVQLNVPFRKEKQHLEMFQQAKQKALFEKELIIEP